MLEETTQHYSLSGLRSVRYRTFCKFSCGTDLSSFAETPSESEIEGRSPEAFDYVHKPQTNMILAWRDLPRVIWITASCPSLPVQ